MEEEVFYKEEEAVQFIRKSLSEESNLKFSDAEILEVVDLIYDYYDSKGFFDDEDDKEIEIDEDELRESVIQNAKSGSLKKFDELEIQAIVNGELEYCDSINLFE